MVQGVIIMETGKNDASKIIDDLIKEQFYFIDGDSRLDYFINEKLTRQLGRIESEGKQ